MDLNVATATEDALIDYCIKKGEKDTLGDDVIGAVVVKVTDKIVAKWGCTVTAGEAAMHEFAYKNLDRNIVRVPQLYRFVRDESGAGYLFMEYIPGQNLADLDIICHQDIIPRIAKIVQHLGQIQAPEQKPGPINDQGPRGYLWGDEGVRNAFGSVDYLNDWLNRRLTLLNEVTKRNDSVDISPYPLVLCHMDLCRRNMILGEDGKSIYLLDWGHAGFFPRFYEVATLSCLNPYDEDYEQPLIEAVESLLQLTDDEKRDMKMIHYARAASLRWSLYVKQC